MRATPNMALQRTRRPRLRSGRSRCSLGSPLNAPPLATQKRLFASAILAGIALALPPSLAACQCGHSETTAESFERSKNVFQGEALWLEPAWATVPQIGYKFPLRRWRFRVLKVWKGAPSREAVVVDGSGNCSYGFTSGKNYLVFGRQHPTLSGSLHTTICTATREVAEGDTLELGQGIVVQAARPLGPEPLLRRARRVSLTAWYSGLALVTSYWRRFKEDNPAGALLTSYMSAFAGVVLLVLGARSSFRGHFKSVAVAVGVLAVIASATVLTLGGWYASRNPFLHDLIRLGA
jgi:hypothetical protein